MKFIDIEGLDGSGKSTQLRLLKYFLKEQGIQFEYLHFPRTDSPYYGELIARFLRGELGAIDTVNPFLVALLYAGDRMDASTQIRQWLSKGKLVIVDRYVYSNIAYQCAKSTNTKESEQLAEWILNFEFHYNKIPVPDISLFLDVPSKFTKSSLSSGRKGADREYLNGSRDIHEENLDFQQRVRNVYLQQVKKQKDFIHIDCTDDNNNMLPPERIFEKIVDSVRPVLFQ